MWPFKDQGWRALITQKRKQRDDAMEKVATRLLSFEEDVDLTCLSATAAQIVLGIKSGRWTASMVMRTFLTRAVLAQTETNCFTEVLFDEALHEAEQLDLYYGLKKTLRGPLHGIPVSITDQFCITGVDASIGYTSRVNNPSSRDASVVSIIKAAGGIIIGKTTLPQCLHPSNCSSPLWGVTTNPWNNEYSTNGSSGGESALIAMDGSALGIGTDLNGGVRVAAHNTGIYSLKPGKDRISISGIANPMPGFQSLSTVSGPLARSVEDLKLACMVLFGASSANRVSVPPVKFRHCNLSPKLRFGYYLSDEIIKASPACQRAVLETVDALRTSGYMCEEFKIPKVLEALSVYMALMSSDGFEQVYSHLGNDPIVSSFFCRKFWYTRLRVLALKDDRLTPSSFIERVKRAAFKEDTDEICSLVRQSIKACSALEERRLIARKEAYTELWCQEWDKHSFDAIIGPVQASPALPQGAVQSPNAMITGTFLYNLTDSPVGVIPVTRVDPTVDDLSEEWYHGAGRGSATLEEELYGKASYNPQKMKGMPVGVQVVGRHWEEEKLIEIMSVVDKALGPRRFGPGSWH